MKIAAIHRAERSGASKHDNTREQGQEDNGGKHSACFSFPSRYFSRADREEDDHQYHDDATKHGRAIVLQQTRLRFAGDTSPLRARSGAAVDQSINDVFVEQRARHCARPSTMYLMISAVELVEIVFVEEHPVDERANRVAGEDASSARPQRRTSATPATMPTTATAMPV